MTVARACKSDRTIKYRLQSTSSDLPSSAPRTRQYGSYFIDTAWLFDAMISAKTQLKDASALIAAEPYTNFSSFFLPRMGSGSQCVDVINQMYVALERLSRFCTRAHQHHAGYGYALWNVIYQLGNKIIYRRTLPPNAGDGMWEQKPSQSQMALIPVCRRQWGDPHLKARRPKPANAGDGMWEQKPPQSQTALIPVCRRQWGDPRLKARRPVPPNAGDGVWEQKPPQSQMALIPVCRRQWGDPHLKARRPVLPNAGDGTWEQKPPQRQTALIPIFRQQGNR
jgi:hypothetical protein